MILTKLVQLYIPLIGNIALGWLCSRWIPAQTPFYLGKGLFLLGVPISVFVFLRRTDLSDSIWLAGAAAWWAMLMGLAIMFYLLRRGLYRAGLPPTQGTTLLAAMLGNTGYLGFPITLTLFGDSGFAWALFYDLLGTVLGAYGAGALIASHYGTKRHDGKGFVGVLAVVQQALRNPTIWAFGLALLYRDPLPPMLEQGLWAIAWGTISLCLLLIGMRLSQLTSLQQLRRVALPLCLKMLLLPLIMWGMMFGLSIPPIAKQVIVLQTAMPPAFATVVLTEHYQLDPEFAVAVVAIGTLGLLLTLPLWLWLTSVF
jgi:hypothetical protein